MKALLIVAGADGLSPSEAEYFADWQKMCGAPEATIEALRKFDYGSVDVEEVIRLFNELTKQAPAQAEGMKRSLLYDAIRLASVDGDYSESERKALHNVASLLGVESRTVAALERQVELENLVRANRLALLYDGG